MTGALVLRLLAARGADLALDTAVLVWAEERIGFTDAEYLRHCCGLTGDLAGAARFAAYALPGGLFTCEWEPAQRRATVAVGVGGAGRPLVGFDLANSLLAATIACHARASAGRCEGASDTPIALARRA